MRDSRSDLLLIPFPVFLARTERSTGAAAGKALPPGEPGH